MRDKSSSPVRRIFRTTDRISIFHKTEKKTQHGFTMATIQHTYLRYECADTFGLVLSTGSSKAPPSNAILKFLDGQGNFLATTAGSCSVVYNTKTSLPVIRFYHNEELSGGVGTGRSLSSDEIVCIDTFATAETIRLASGWVDGAIRVWTVPAKQLVGQSQSLAHTLLHDTDESDQEEPPLVLNGHNQSPIRTLAFDQKDGSRLGSGGSDGSVVLWDVVAETGLFRLLGHRGGITELIFHEMEGLDALITASIDGFIKIWDIGGQCCIQTIANHRGEVLGASCSRLWTNHSESEDNASSRCRLITGGSDGLVRVWSVQTPQRLLSTLVSDSDESADNSVDDVCKFMGTLVPPPNVSTSADKVQSVQFHPNGKFVGIHHGNTKNIDVYIVRSVQESFKKRQRRLKRREEKEKKKPNTVDNKQAGQKRGILDDPESSDEEEKQGLQTEEQQLDPKAIKASDEFEYLTTIKASHKARGFAFARNKEKGELVRVVVALTTNAFEAYSFSRTSDKEGTSPRITVKKITSMNIAGHPTGIRAVALSSDDKLACTVSKNTTMIWNVESRSCLQSLSPASLSTRKDISAYGLCVAFLPGNTHVVIGTREGHLLIVDIAAGEVVFSDEDAHEAAIWSIDVRRPTTIDGTIGLVTGSADKSVKFWDVESSDDDDTADHPVAVHQRTLQMTDDVVAVRYSYALQSSKRMVCVSTLDCTVKVFFEDSLKLFLSLYGHKLPVLAIDCSDDDVLLVSASADKTVKIWGLDFGDTHRTLHGHEDSITDIRFVRRTHNFFSSSKDGTVRYWDGDRFEQVLLLNGHTAEVNCLAVSKTGAFVLSSGMDRQVRVWERTKDIVFLEEERERELEQVFDRIGNRGEKATATILDQQREDDGDDGESVTDDNGPQSEAAVKKSVLSVSAGDRLMEGLERADQELKDIASFRSINQQNVKKRQANPMLMGLAPALYVLWILKSIKSSDLEQSLLVLPHTHIERLLYYCSILLKQGRGVEICARVAVFLVKTHQSQIVSTKSLAVPLRDLRHQLRKRLAESRDIVGYNLIAMKLIGRTAQDRKHTFIGDEDGKTHNVWAGLGLGSDVAAALDGRPNKK
jgi:U3 small nucleolar RNA-associated protein 12